MPQLETLGGLALRVDGRDVLPGRRKVLALLAYLARQREPVAREQLARTFWPESSETRARHSLRQAIGELRSQGIPLEVGADDVALARGGVQVDVEAFEMDVEAERWDAALGRWRGDFLPGLDELDGPLWHSWLSGQRSRLAGFRARALAATRSDASRGAAGGLPPSLQAAPRWANRETAEAGPVREITGGLLGTLSTEARAVIEAASVLGRRMDAQALAAVAGLSRNGFTSALDELGGRGMLYGSPEVPGALEFSSEGARQRVYRLVGSDRRRHLHRLAAEALSAQHGVDLHTAEHQRLAAPAPTAARGRRAVLTALLLLVAGATAAALWYLLPGWRP